MTRLFAIAALAAAGLTGAYLWTAPQPALPVIGTAHAQEVDTSSVIEMTQGNPDADVTVVEYASFTCPHCASFHEGAYADLKADYIDTGKINFIYREVYFDRFGLWAGLVARCGGEDRYFGIVDMIYEQQRDWIGDGEPATIVENLKTIGKKAGLSGDEVDACLQDGDKAQALVAVYQENAEADDVRATPTFMVNGSQVSSAEFSANFRSILDDEIGG